MQTNKLYSEICDEHQEGRTTESVCFWQPRSILTELEMPRRQTQYVKNWEKIAPKLIFDLTEILQTRWPEAARIEGIEREVILIKERIATLEKSSPACVPIETFAPEPYEVLKPFHVVIQTHDDEYVSSFFDANLSASGSTEAEAILNIKDVILGVFDCLLKHAEADLGPEPLRQLRVLKTFLKKTS